MHLHIADGAPWTAGDVIQTNDESALIAPLAAIVGRSRSRALLHRVGVNGIEHFDAEELAIAGGIPTHAAARIVAAREFARALRARQLPVATDPNGLIAALPPALRELEREALLGIALNGRSEVKALLVLAVGGVSGACVTPRDVFVPLVRHAAVAYALAHNHPSGDPLPSDDDVRMTNALAVAGVRLGIPLVDHLVVARSGFTSFLEAGLLLSEDEIQLRLDAER